MGDDERAYSEEHRDDRIDATTPEQTITAETTADEGFDSSGPGNARLHPTGTRDVRSVPEQGELDRTGAFHYDSVLEKEQPPPEEFTNPSGIARGDCDWPTPAQDPECDHETTAHIDDKVLEETKPGFGIPGFEAEEDGGG